VPYIDSPACDSCRVSLARDTVDSLRAGNPTAGFLKSIALSLGGILAAVVVICRAEGCQLE